MILTLQPDQLEKVIKEGLSSLGILDEKLLLEAKITVYRKGKQICAKIILK